MATVEYAHITFGPDQVPMIAGTTTKVVEVVLDHLGHGMDAHEIHRQYPYLSLGQIHSALAYYFDHQEEIDQDIIRRMERVKELKLKMSDKDLKLKLKAKGLLP